MNPVAPLFNVPWEGGPYSIKRHGVTITNCDTEPVQTPGCIQAHGALLVLRPADLTILQASENAGDFFGTAASDLLGKPVLTAIGDEAQSRIEHVLQTEMVEHNPLYVSTINVRDQILPMDLSLHTIDHVAIVECEPTGNAVNPLAPDHYERLTRSVDRLQAATTLIEFCQNVCEEMRALTSLDRVMVYKLHADDHGEVFAESRREDLPSWVGHHYPAEDIPLPAREIFQRIWIRPVVDANGQLAELVPLVNPETGKPLTMTYCALRGASVMYTEYLNNMGVKASLTMPIRRNDKLWGLIACHHLAGPAFVPYRTRAACAHLAQVASLQHKAVVEREQFAYRVQMNDVHQRLVAQAARAGGLGGLDALIEGKPNLLDAMQASGAALYHRNRWLLVGNTPTESQLDAFSEWAWQRFSSNSPANSVYATDSLSVDYPPASAFQASASGLVAIPLARRGKQLLLWFRPETMQTVTWGGNPHDMPVVPGPHGPRLTPRKSFEVFVETVSGRSLPWKDVEIDAVLRLRALVTEMVVEQAEQLAQLNEELARSNEELDAFACVASHDLKEPLRGIHKYAQQCIESPASLDDERQTRLQALMQLTVRMDNLLDSLLHYSRVGRIALQRERLDLGEVVAEALEIVTARRTDRATEIVIHRPLPTAFVDRIRVREVFVNLIANALKYNDKPKRHVEIGFLAPKEDGERGMSPPEAVNQYVYYVRDNGIGIQSKHYEQIFRMFRRLHARDKYGGGAGAGLTITKKLIERHHGQIWLSSVPGQGTTFYFTLPEQDLA
jgi:chemotaxis family two-component system sensor kinase Cph1